MEKSNQTSTHVSASIYFLKKTSLYDVEKPYAFRYATGDVKQTNMEMEKISSIMIEDIRGKEKMYTMDQHGFTVLNLGQDFVYTTFFNEKGLEDYIHVLEDTLKKLLGAKEVRIFRHGLRKRHPKFPISTGEAYEYDQPTSVAHVDTTPEEAENEIRRQYGINADGYLNMSRYQWINIWKPLKGPLNDWPLTFSSSATVEVEDLEAADLLYPDLATENFQLYFRDRHKWYYLSSQRTSEAIVFKQSDSDPTACLGVPHCSFFNPLASPDEDPRESIEVRALVFYY